MIEHPIEPVCFADSRVLILGSFPSVKSRESGFYYGHPQNRFWCVMATLFGEEVPIDREAKIALLRRNRIALWDVLARCDISGSADASIRNEEPNDLTRIFAIADIRSVFTNGHAAHALYQKYMRPRWDINDTCLPSTSPANAAWSMARLTDAWQAVAEQANGPAGEND